MSFSDWQVRRFRSRLKAYRERQGLRELGRPLPWKTVEGRIVRKTDVEIGDERLRQFVEGVPQKHDTKARHFPVPESHKVEAIRNFLTDDSIRYLATHELEQPTGVHYAAQSLLEFFGGEPEKLSLLASRIAGVYQDANGQDGSYASLTLTINRASGAHVCEVTKHYERFRNPLVNIPFSDWSEPDKLRHRTLKKTSTGWAVLNAQGEAFIFLCEPYQQEYCTYLVIGSGCTRNEDWILLLRYASPGVTLANFGTEAVIESALKDINRSGLIYMTCIEDFD